MRNALARSVGFVAVLTMTVIIVSSCNATNEAKTAAPTPAQLAFRSAVDSPPPGWSGPVFQLSHDYPKQAPTCDAPWLKRKVSFTDSNQKWNGEWAGYVDDIVKYVMEGQEPDLPDNPGWRATVGGSTRWFHIPWMAYDGQRGREFVHGLTNELSTAESTFTKLGRGTGKHTLPGAKKVNGQEPLFETWSVGFYNPCGAAAIGQAFPESGVPATHKDSATGRMRANGLPFPEGTVVIKILNTTADSSQVDYLKGAPTWRANGHVQKPGFQYDTCQRAIRDVHLVQMDIAVVDPRSPTHWVYSTLAYDGRLKGKTVWSRMHPLGVQWGNDHGTFPAVSGKGVPLHETLIAPIGIPEHYGCGRRLAGVVDQPNSSCVSCHMGAFTALPGTLQKQGGNVPPIFYFPGLCTDSNTAANALYFSDYSYPSPFPGGQFDDAIPLDSSLQLAVAYAQYAVFMNPQVPRTCPDAGATRATSKSMN